MGMRQATFEVVDMQRPVHVMVMLGCSAMKRGVLESLDRLRREPSRHRGPLPERAEQQAQHGDAAMHRRSIRGRMIYKTKCRSRSRNTNRANYETARSLSAFATTDTDDRLIAIAAITGESRIPKAG